MLLSVVAFAVVLAFGTLLLLLEFVSLFGYNIVYGSFTSSGLALSILNVGVSSTCAGSIIGSNMKFVFYSKWSSSGFLSVL